MNLIHSGRNLAVSHSGWLFLGSLVFINARLRFISHGYLRWRRCRLSKR